MAELKNTLVGVNDKGLRIGETHHRAKFTDADIDLIRELHEETVLPDGRVLPGLSYSAIAAKMDCSKSTVRDIIKCRRRFQFVTRWKKVSKKLLTDV